MIIERFTRLGNVVLDTILVGRPDPALAAAKLGRNFIGAWHDRAGINYIKTRLAREGVLDVS